LWHFWAREPMLLRVQELDRELAMLCSQEPATRLHISALTELRPDEPATRLRISALSELRPDELG
jgi:hypothetical protein